MNITAELITAASESYSFNRLQTNPFPGTTREYKLLLETAFIEGAPWYQRQTLQELEGRLTAIRSEGANAR